MIIGIESSCDESSIAFFSPASGVIGFETQGQLDLHKQYGGVVPALSSREHMIHLPGLLQHFKEQGINFSQTQAIAVTYGPGLAGCLSLGIACANSLSIAFNKPIIGVNHLRGHAFSPFLPLYENDPKTFTDRLKNYLPHLGLLVSGGNTLLFEVDNALIISILGETTDDAAGEALDKGARMLGKSYPGGAWIERIAEKGNPAAFQFPRAFTNDPRVLFSFSGLKTSLRYLLESMEQKTIDSVLPDLCASYQQAVIEALCNKVSLCLKQKRYASFGISGGVSNNKVLRRQAASLAQLSGVQYLQALPEHTGDNAAMIAFASFIDPLAMPVSAGLLQFEANAKMA